MFRRTIVSGLCLGMLLATWATADESDVNGLTDKLGDADVKVRLHAIDQLGRLGSKASPAVPALRTLLRDESAAVRARAAGALGEVGEAAQSAVPDLVESIADPEPAVRRSAVQALARLRPDPEVSIPLLVQLMEDSEPTVRLRALDALAEHGEDAVPALIKALANDASAYWACLVLNQIGPAAKDAIPALVERLTDQRVEVRREALLALAEIGEAASPAGDDIAKALEADTDRVSATYALGRIGRIPPDAKSQIVANTASSDEVLRVVSIWALARTHPGDKTFLTRATYRLINLLKSKEPRTRNAAAQALASLRPGPEIATTIVDEALLEADEETVQHILDAVSGLGPAVVPRLISALRFEKHRPRIAYVLGEIGPAAEPAVEALVELVDAPNPQTQHEALIALAKIGPGARAAVPALISAIQEREGPIQHGAAYALGRVGPEAASAKPALLTAVESNDDTLVLLAAWALAQIDPQCPTCTAKTVPLLIAALEHPWAKHRREAAVALGAIGPAAKSAVPALAKAEEDSDADVRAAATAALKAVAQ